MPAALIRHLYSPSPPVWAFGNVGNRLFDDPDGVAMGSQPVRKLDPFAIAYLVVVVRQKIEIEAHWYSPTPPSRHGLSLELQRKSMLTMLTLCKAHVQHPKTVSVRLIRPVDFYRGFNTFGYSTDGAFRSLGDANAGGCFQLSGKAAASPGPLPQRSRRPPSGQPSKP